MSEPFQQGDLDGLCGLYACINAARLLTRINDETGERLLLEAVLTLEKKSEHLPILPKEPTHQIYQ